MHEAYKVSFPHSLQGKICRGLLSLTQEDTRSSGQECSHSFCHLYPPKSDSTRFENLASWASTWQIGENSKELHRHDTLQFSLFSEQRKQSTCPLHKALHGWASLLLGLSSPRSAFSCYKDIGLLLRSLLPVTAILKWAAFEAIVYLSWGLLILWKVWLNMLISIKAITFISWKQYPKSQCRYYQAMIWCR